MMRRGDTLVEVLLATVVLSIVLTTAYTLSNRAVKINQLAYERGQVTGYMQTQAELLRAAKNADTNAAGEPWDLINARAQAAYFSCSDADLSIINAVVPAGTFYIDDSLNVVNGVQQLQSFYNIWINRVSNNPEYTDFYIYGCWQGADRGINQVAGITVRILR